MITAKTPEHSSVGQIVFSVLSLLSLAVLLGLALAVPFFYQTETLWYKTGVDKILLRTGQQAGLATLVFLLVQILLSLSGRFSKSFFGVANLMRWHRMNGPVLACLASCHVLLVLAPEGLGNIPIGKKYWPEMTGEGLFLLILLTVAVSHFRAGLKLDYKKWRACHRLLGYVIPVLAVIHVLNVSESFQQGAPRIVLLVLFAAAGLFAVAVKSGRRKAKT